MLKYLVQLTNDMMPACIIFGMLFAYIRFKCEKLGKIGKNILLTGLGVSVIASVVMSYMKNATAKINIGYWNLYTYLFYGIALVLFIIVTILSRILKTDEKTGVVSKIIQISVPVTAALVTLPVVFYSLPDVLAYPFNFNLSGNSVMSTDFLFRLIGVILGFILAALTGLGAYKAIKTMPRGMSRAFIFTILGIEAFSFFGKSIQIMVTRRIIHRSAFFSKIIRIAVNYSEYFIIAVIAVAFIAAVVMFIRNIKVTQEYSNPAQHRKIRAAMRNQRRWSSFLALCAVLGCFILTAVDAYNNRAPYEAPVEESFVDGDEVYVTFDQVSDGHLHRFGYLTDDNIEVRFIIIKKPNSSAYGVGLDACDICGEAGYFERGGQVVCKKCDVVMNINTIGFKGGCNPIVIDYRIEDGKIIVPIEELVKNKGEFD